MKKKSRRWETIHKSKITNKKLKVEEVINVLLRNRGIRSGNEKQEFFKPTPPDKLRLKELGIDKKAVDKTIKRLYHAKKNREKIIIYGDYDADGICASAILWEELYGLGFDVLPHIPKRFTEGYGLNTQSIEDLKSQFSNLKLIITVDNGIVANKAVDVANKLDIDVVICDHHQVGKKLPKAISIIHTDKICASAIAWILAREISKSSQLTKNSRNTKLENQTGLDLVAVGTIADQIPLVGVNRSLAKYGLEALNVTKRLGLNALYEEAGLKKGSIGSYAVGFVIAPRLNAMGRLEHAIDSLRLLCTKNSLKATELARYLGKTNSQRQRVVEEVVLHAKEMVSKRIGKGLIILSHETYHEGVIGLAAAKLVEEFYRPAIVLSKGKKISKASARSIPGFNIIEFIHRYDAFLEGGGGHPMAAGFSIRTAKIAEFSKLAEEESRSLLTEELTTRTLKIDMSLEFEHITLALYQKLKEFEPAGLGNSTPTFVTRQVKVREARIVGQDGKHLKLILEKDDKKIPAVAFGMADFYREFSPEKEIDVAFSIDENVWNGNRNLELKIKDIKL